MFYHLIDVPELIVRHSMVFLSDDIIHDSNAVKYFENKVIEFLEKKKLKYREIVIFSDECAGQHKSRNNLSVLANEKNIIQRHYFRSENVTSECDGEVASVNRSVDSVVLGRQAVITNAPEMHKWCSGHIFIDEPGSKRDFFLVAKDSIDHSKGEAVNPVKGIWSIHQVNNDPQTPGEPR